MNRPKFFLAICAMLAGASAAMPQQPAPPVPPAPPVAPVAPVPPAPRILRDEVDDVWAQVDALRFQINKEEIRENVQRSVDAALAKQTTFGAGFGRGQGMAF